jgi:F0F1-type ATP synthase membrane subunit b/b'
MLAILILAFASFSTNANAYVYKDIDNMLSKFYKKIDNALPDIDKRIEKLNKVNKKVNRILIIKKDVLSYKSIQLL